MPSWDRKLCEHWENSDTHPGLWFTQITSPNNDGEVWFGLVWFIQISSPNNDGEVGQITFAQTLGAGSVEEQLAFEARYEFVTITKVGGDHDDDVGDDDNHKGGC